MDTQYSKDQLLDLVEALENKLEQVTEQIEDAMDAMYDLDENDRERQSGEIIGLQRERNRINLIIQKHMQTLKDMG